MAIGEPFVIEELVGLVFVLRRGVAAALSALARGGFFFRAFGVFVVDAGAHAAAFGPPEAGVPAAHVEGEDIAWLGDADIVGDLLQLLAFDIGADIVVQRSLVRAGHQAQGAGVGINRIEVEGEFDAVAIFVGIDAMVGVPAGVADVAVGVGADGKGVVAIELGGDRPEALVLEQVGVEGRFGPHLFYPVAFGAVEGMVLVSEVKALFEFAAQGFDLVGGKELA